MMACLKAIDLKDTPTGPGLVYLNLFRKAEMLNMTVPEFEALPRAKAEALVMAAWHDRDAARADSELNRQLYLDKANG